MLSFLVKHFFHTSIACVALYVNSQLLRGFTIDWIFASLLFSLTLAVYNFNSLFISRSKIRIALILVSALTSIYLAYLSQDNLFENPKILSIALGIVIFYSLPIEKSHIRRIHFLKILLIAFVWGYAAIATNNWLNNITKVTFLYSFLLTFSLTIPFDMRDASIDTFKTIPNTIGINKSTYLSITIYFISTLPVYFLSLNLSAFLLILIIGVMILFFSKKHFHNNNYLAFVELIIPIQTLILSTTLL